MAKRVESPVRGILHHPAAFSMFELVRFQPCDEISDLVEHYWVVKWDLEGKPSTEKEVLSHPSVHLVFEKDNTHIYGVFTKKFVRKLNGTGRVIGIKFRPAGFHAFYAHHLDELTNKTLEFKNLFSFDPTEIENLLSGSTDQELADAVEEFLLHSIPSINENISLVNEIVYLIRDNPQIKRVEDLVDQAGLSKRSLQRRFKEYVGVSPKWVIQRYRLQEAAQKIDSGKVTNWIHLSEDLGYYDQAHFIKDFKAIVGVSPGEYLLQSQTGNQNPTF